MSKTANRAHNEAKPVGVELTTAGAAPNGASLHWHLDQPSRAADGGDVVPDRQIEQLSRKGSHTEAGPPPISLAAIPTRLESGRRPRLQDSIESLIENCQRHCRRPNVAVMDDSPSAAERSATRQMLAALRDRARLPILYAGLEEKLAYADELCARAGADPAVITFALTGTMGIGHSAGANRNAILLHGAGELLLTVDDDVLCRTSQGPNPRNDLALDSQGQVQGFHFFADREAALRAVKFIDIDMLGAHEEFLGRGLVSIVKTAGGQSPGRAIRMDAGFAGREGRVLVTQSGTVGDSGMSAPAWLWLKGESRDRLVASEAAYRSAFSSREILRIAKGPTVTTDPWCMATALGCDNRELLPPFFPVLRNQDGLFGVSLRTCFPDSLIAHIPIALLHAPEGSRQTSDLWRRAECVDMWNLVLVCLTSHAPTGAGSARQRMQELGERLVEIGSLTGRGFDSLVRQRLASQHAAVIQALEDLDRQYASSPEYWSRDVAGYIERLRHMLRRDGHPIPRDLAGIVGPQKAMGVAASLVREFGRLLGSWPDIVEAAKDLKTQGVTLGRQVG